MRCYINERQPCLAFSPSPWAVFIERFPLEPGDVVLTTVDWAAPFCLRNVPRIPSPKPGSTSVFLLSLRFSRFSSPSRFGSL